MSWEILALEQGACILGLKNSEDILRPLEAVKNFLRIAQENKLSK